VGGDVGEIGGQGSVDKDCRKGGRIVIVECRAPWAKTWGKGWQGGYGNDDCGRGGRVFVIKPITSFVTMFFFARRHAMAKILL
jgi:hypothetical protein